MILSIVIILIAVAAYLIFKNKKAPEVITTEKPTTVYKDLLQQHVDYYRKLGDDEKVRFETLVADFLNNTHIECVDTEITDTDRVFIASSAVIPIFGFPGWRYQNLTNVILYPDAFDPEFETEGEGRNILGMVGSGYMNGQMLLSRAALTKGFSDNAGKENAAIHEFVHLLDKSDGATDGLPENLMPHEYAKPWLHMMHQEMHRIEAGKSDINPYALTNEAEFLAVAAEYFFEKPAQFKTKHAELYEQLSRMFAQHPDAV